MITRFRSEIINETDVLIYVAHAFSYKIKHKEITVSKTKSNKKDVFDFIIKT